MLWLPSSTGSARSIACPSRSNGFLITACYVAGDTRSSARDIGLEPRTTPLESPRSNGMAEAFVRTIKRDYVRVSPRPDAATVMRQLPTWIAHHNELHPHKALGYRSPREFIAAHENWSLAFCAKVVIH